MKAMAMILVTFVLVGCTDKSGSKTGDSSGSKTGNKSTASVEPVPAKRKAAIAAIGQLGGEVTVDEKKPGKPVIAVSFNNTKVTDTELAHLKGLISLQNLNLQDTKVTDAGLIHLVGLTNLEDLNLSGTNVGDAGLVHLKGLTKIQKLDLNGTKITNAGLVHLNGLIELQSLDVTDTKVTAAGVKTPKAALPKCQIVR